MIIIRMQYISTIIEELEYDIRLHNMYWLDILIDDVGRSSTVDSVQNRGSMTSKRQGRRRRRQGRREEHEQSREDASQQPYLSHSSARSQS